jgi:hypothetical protein
MRSESIEGEPRVDDSERWAMSWLTELLGPNGPGMTRPVVVHDDRCAGLAPPALAEQLRELRRPIVDGIPKNGRYAVVYERRRNGHDCVVLEAAEYTFGMIGARLLFVQPVRRVPGGAVIADGEPRQLQSGDAADRAARARIPTVRAVADSVRAGARRGFGVARRASVIAGSARAASVRRRSAGSRTTFIVALWVGVLLLGVMSAVSLTEFASSSRAAVKSRAADHRSERAAGQAVPVRPAATAAPAPAGTPPRPPVAQGPVPGDLGLSVPMSRPACDGGYGVIVANATRPGDYRHEVGEFLARFSGASYLLAEQACSSLRSHTPSGASIYAVYYGPYPAVGNACATRSRIGRGSYVRKLDNGPESSVIIKC